MKQKSSKIPKMKATVNKEDFTPEEHEVSTTFLSLGTPFVLEEKSIRETTDNNPNDVTENKYNPPDIPTIPGIPNNNIVDCCKPFEKKLYASDLKVNLNRLMMNTKHVIEYLLPSLREGEKIEDGINVIAYDMQGKTFDMTFKYWQSGGYYILNGEWKTFFQTHNLKASGDQDHYVKVWMFRHLETDNLCFALSVRIEQTKKEDVGNYKKRARSLDMRVADGEGTSYPAELAQEMAQDEATCASKTTNL